MTETAVQCNLHGLRLAVRFAEPLLIEELNPILGAYVVDHGEAADHVLSLRYGPATPPVDGWTPPIVWSSGPTGRMPMVYGAAPGRRQVEIPGSAWMRVDLMARQAEVVVRPGGEGCLVEGCFAPLLCEFLGQMGQHVIHAASLAVEWGDRRVAVVLPGPSGSGKTTTALSLASDGMVLMADDMTFVGRSGEAEGQAAPKLWGLSVRCKVLPRTLELLPWLERFLRRQSRVPGEWLVEIESLVSAGRGMTADPGVLAFLEPRNSGCHRFEPIGKTEALARLLRENVRAFERTADGPAGRAFAALASLVSASHTCTLSIGRSLEGLGAALRTFLEP
jgi:hypothetical protein